MTTLTPSLPATVTSSPALISPPLGGIAGLVAGAILVVNAAKIAGLVPTAPLTQLLAPGGQAVAVIFILGLAARAVPRSVVGEISTALAVLGLTFGVGVEYLLNFVLRDVSADVRAALLGGPLSLALVGTSVVFLIGSLALAVLLLRGGIAPRLPVLGYALGALVVGLRAAVPNVVFLVGLGLLVVSMVALSVWLVRGQSAGLDPAPSR